MLAVALIVFREVLEAALIVGIVMAASRGVTRRGLWVAGGVAAGIVGAVIVAGFAEAIAEAASGLGQELFNAMILLAAVGLLGWHNVWMGRHGREMAAEMNQVGRAVAWGARPLHVLGAVVAVAVLREGSEVVLFLRPRCDDRGRLGDDADGRCVGRDRRGGAGARPLLRVAENPNAASVHGDELADLAARRGDGLAGGAVPGAGRSAADPGRRAVGYVVAVEQTSVVGACCMC